MKTNRINGLAQWKSRLNVESLEERSLMSASPLNWTAPAGSPNNINLSVVSDKIEIFDNGTLAASQNVSDTSAITITTAGRVANSVTIASTPAGIATTVNLKGVGDSVFVGDTGDNAGSSHLHFFSDLVATTVQNRAVSTIDRISIIGITTPAVPAATMANILGAVTINGTLGGKDSVVLADARDTGAHRAVLTSSSVTGLSPASINFKAISSLTVDGATSQSGYAVTGAAGSTSLFLEGSNDTVSVTSTAGSVSVHGNVLATAFIAGTATGVNRLTAGPGYATLTGAGYTEQVTGFTHVTVSSKSASDTAVLNGVANGGNTLTANPTDAVLTADGATVEAVGFQHLTAYGSNAYNDVATLTGAATGKNTLVALADDMSLTGTGYSLQAFWFGNDNAYSLSASDTATLYAAAPGDNTLVGTPTQTSMSNGSYRSAVYGFASVTAYGGYAGDTAYLFGASSGTNNLVANPHSATFSGAGYSFTAAYFASVYAYSESAGDAAYLSGTGSFLFATRTTTQLSGNGYFVQTSNFPSTFETLTATTFELTSSGSLLEAGSLVIGRLAAAVATQAPRAVAINGGLHNIVNSWITVDSAFDNIAIGKLVNTNYVWDCNSSGIHTFGPAATGASVAIAQTLTYLSNANVQSVLFRDMVRDGALTYNGMLDTFNVVEEGSTVDAGTLADLRILVQCASTLEMPADVADLANSVVNGEAANGTFRYLDTNGNVMKTGMGNLQAGSSTYLLTELVDTWFLGVDEPDAAKSYSAVTGSLFNTGGPVYTDVHQGSVGDCWLMASVAEVAARDPGYLTNMFTYEGTNTVNGATVNVYSVRFFSHEGYGVPHYVTVDTELPAGGGMYDHPVNGAYWVALLEKAYAEASAAGWVTTSNGNSNSYSALNGGWPSYALPALTNLSTAEHDINASAAATAFQAGDLVVLCTGGSPNTSEIVPDHCYALVAYDASSSTPFKVYNPWGTDSSGNALGDYNGHSVYGLFNATATFINQNFNHQSIGAAIPDSVDDLATTLASSRTATTGIDELMLALAESLHGSHHDDLLAV